MFVKDIETGEVLGYYEALDALYEAWGDVDGGETAWRLFNERYEVIK